MNEQHLAGSTPALILREVQLADVEQLDQLEKQCFDNDRLSLRRFKHWVKASNCVFIVAEENQCIIGYGLVLLHKGTRLARLYSLAVSPQAQGAGIGRKLLKALESMTKQRHRLYMRLEVATDNTAAIKLYESMGYSSFDCVSDYYEDHRDALRMQKRIRFIEANLLQHSTPWYKQTTEFTCGPAALLMAMASIDPSTTVSQEEELDIWREATTIFMTSGHGGCHPVGLALAAHSRGFHATAYINRSTSLFIDGVRSAHKKSVLEVVDRQFRNKARDRGINVLHQDFTQDDIAHWLTNGFAIVVLISTYRIDGKKAPHWVTVSGIDDECLYVHDPDFSDEKYSSADCQYIPIARSDFAGMAAFGSEKLRTCIVIKQASA